MRGVGVKNFMETLLRSEGSLDKGSKIEIAQPTPHQGCVGSGSKTSKKRCSEAKVRLIRDRKSKMHRCTPTRDAWLKSATYLGILRKSIQRSWPDSPTRKGCRTILLLPGDAFQRLWRGGPPRKHTRTRLLLQGNEFQRLRPGGSPRRGLPRKGNRSFQSSGQGVPQERLQNKILITRKCLPEALARGSPQERLQNKILITRKSSRARFLLPGNAFQRLWPWGPPGKAPEEDCFYQEMRSRGSGGGSRPGKAPEQDCYYLEVPSRGLARESPQERL